MPFLPLSISPPRATICALASRASPSPVRFSLNAGFLRFVRGSLAPRCFCVLFPAVFRAVSLFCSPRYSAVFFLLFPGIGCRLFFVLCPSLYLGPCFYSAGCYPAFSYVFSPASDAVFSSSCSRVVSLASFFSLSPYLLPFLHSPLLLLTLSYL